MLVMDSGLGGISVVRELRAQAPLQPLSYLADTGFFPYGSRTREELSARAVTLLEKAARAEPLSTIVLACNTLSTLCLADLRAALPYRFVGTVPAVKTAAAQSSTGRFTLLATPNTAHSSYSCELIAQFAAGCQVDRVAAPQLARMAEAWLLGEPIDHAALAAEIAPAFHDDAAGRTDTIVLGCTHYPLLTPLLTRLAPWPVRWIDSGAAIARRALELHGSQQASPATGTAYVTAAGDLPRYAPLFTREGFTATQAL